MVFHVIILYLFSICHPSPSRGGARARKGQSQISDECARMTGTFAGLRQEAWGSESSMQSRNMKMLCARSQVHVVEMRDNEFRIHSRNRASNVVGGRENRHQMKKSGARNLKPWKFVVLRVYASLSQFFNKLSVYGVASESWH